MVTVGLVWTWLSVMSVTTFVESMVHAYYRYVLIVSCTIRISSGGGELRQIVRGIGILNRCTIVGFDVCMR